MLARILNGELQLGLPSTGTLQDGRSVSNYELLPVETLAEEGWKEAIENHVEVQDGECEAIDTFSDNGSNVIINYKAAEGDDCELTK